MALNMLNIGLIFDNKPLQTKHFEYKANHLSRKAFAVIVLKFLCSYLNKDN